MHRVTADPTDRLLPKPAASQDVRWAARYGGERASEFVNAAPPGVEAQRSRAEPTEGA